MALLLRLVLGIALVLAGGALLTVGILGVRSRPHRNRLAGVRTRATLASTEAFIVGNRVAGPVVTAAGIIVVLGGIGVLAAPSGELAAVLGVVGGIGGLLLCGAGGVLGDRAAAAVRQAPEAPLCTGSCAGCDLVAGCRDAGPATSGVTSAAGDHQPQVPASPLNGPTTSAVIQPP